MKEYTSTEPVFSEKIQILETSDTTHADNVNVTTKQLLQNTVSNRAMIQEGMGEAGGYSSDVEYHTGEYCMYGNVLYRCLKDTSGEWDPECWQKTTAFGEICSLRHSIDSLIGLFGRDEEGNMKSLGEAAFAGISHNFLTEEDAGMVAGADLLKLLKEQVDAQNSASKINIELFHHIIIGKDNNADEITESYTFPEDCPDWLLVTFGNANNHYSVGIMMLKTLINFGLSTVNQNASNAIETCIFNYDIKNRTVSMSVKNRNNYQKVHGNVVYFYALK